MCTVQHTCCRFEVSLNSVLYVFRLLSCLAHWSSVFAEVKFLPLFVFPFVKVFQNDPFVCFEAVATIICKYFLVQSPHFLSVVIIIIIIIVNIMIIINSQIIIKLCHVRLDMCMVNLKGLG